MAEKYEGKREMKGGNGGKIALGVCAGLLVIILGAYLGLCALAGQRILPNSEALGVELSEVSIDRVDGAMQSVLTRYRGKTITLTGEEVRLDCDLDQLGLAVDTRSVIEQLGIQNIPFPLRGAAWLDATISGARHQAQNVLYFSDRTYLDSLLQELTQTLPRPVIQHEVQMGENSFQLTRGQSGLWIDAAPVEGTLLQKLVEGDLSELALDVVITQPDALDIDLLHQQIYKAPVNAWVDPETYEARPGEVGISFDAAAASKRFDAAAPGESISIPLILTLPELSAEELQSLLFRDCLSTVTSYVSGVAGRVANVQLAGEMCNGMVLMPGEEFSYWDVISPCTAEQGFRPAPSYVKGETVDSIGGGVCQISSSIYYASLLSNLEIVERRNHSYAVGYLPDGADATVFAGSPNFRFRNNTEYPIRIVVVMENRNLSVQLWGTKLDDTYVKMEFVELSRNPSEVIYQIDNTVAVGTEVEKVSAYTGRKVEAYRCIYSGDGTLISRTLESVSNYQRRDRVVLINPADAAKYNVDPVTGAKLPDPPPAPEPMPEPVPEPEVSVEPQLPETTGSEHGAPQVLPEAVG